MTHDEAARTNGAAGQDSPPKAPPIDERPRPRYGEYAPEGWNWQPPVDPKPVPDAPADAAGARSAPAGGVATTAGSPGAPVAVDATAHHAARPKDSRWTIALIGVGLIGLIYNVMVLIQLPSTALESAKLSASFLGADGPTSFTPGPAVPIMLMVGIVLQFALWVGSSLWSLARLRAGRSSWWIPLVAGVVAFFVVMVIAMLVFASDPDFMTALSTAGN